MSNMRNSCRILMTAPPRFLNWFHLQSIIDMANDTLRLHRFMSKAEYIMYQSGEILHNNTDHYRNGKGGSTSKGFCFFIGNVREWAHRLNGLVSFDVLLTVEFNGVDLDGDVYISSGVYADNPSAEYPKRKLYREVCTTAYSRESMRFVSADFSWASDPRFISRSEALAYAMRHYQNRVYPLIYNIQVTKHI